MKTIIIYASKYGYAEDCVKELAAQLQGEILCVNIATSEIPLISEADNLIIGGSIYVGQVDKKLKAYCEAKLELLLQKRIGLFIACGMPENFQLNMQNAFPAALIEHALVKTCLGAELRIAKMNFFHKTVAKVMEKAIAKEGKASICPLPENITVLAEAFNGQIVG
ncbi:MAG: flavodoxin domain-containing protein [Clostridia bacterium]